MKTAEQQLKRQKTNALGEVFSLKNKAIEYFDKYLRPEHGAYVHQSLESFYQSYALQIQESADEAAVTALKEQYKRKIKAFKPSLLKELHLSTRLVLFELLFIPIAIVLLLLITLIKGAGGVVAATVFFIVMTAFVATRKALKKAVFKNMFTGPLESFCQGYFAMAQ